MSTSSAVTPAASGPSPSPSFNATSMKPFSPMGVAGSARSSHQRPLPSISMLNGHTQIFSLLDMELLHHYTTSTCMTLSTSPDLATLWRVNAPQLAYSHEFLMRGLLAIAALHIAYYKPDKRDFYVEKAIALHQQALSTAVTLLANVNDENCTALYLFTAVTLIYTIGSPRKPLDFLIVSENDVSDWLSILRGVKAITDHGHEIIYKGNLGPMFSAGERREQLRKDHINGPPNQDLIDLANFLSKATADPQDLVAYIDSISELQTSFIVLADRGRDSFEPTDMFIWPYQLPDHYLKLLRQRAPGALAIYAHFAVLLKYLDLHWWMKGSAEYLISQIYGLLDEEHRLWIRRPIEQIGWVP
ncbi:hypothetical protein DSL72_004037 [Monilinia vaccinii-corymbosi]|uniref:C6 zinc finger domain-containing protein n=1 Tax=Monilinia vaccinii-corymbosi TaxID=61207 RepID=A0A8A3NVK5_9HELO|nr:hypothetical protein DSL72_004037 [Monilinia vaccinii-corymbosi]